MVTVMVDTYELRLSWRTLEDGSQALIFNARAWRLFDTVAEVHGQDPRAWIASYAAGLCGTVTRMDGG